MKKFLVVKWMTVLAVLVASGHTADVEQANARIFGGRLFGRRAAARPVFFNRRPVAVNRGYAGYRKNGNFIDFRKLKRIQGFSRIRAAGKAAVGVDRFGRNPFAIFVDRFGRLIDRFGNSVAAFQPEVVRDLRDFYFENLDQFRGPARSTVLRFLAANSANTGFLGTLAAGINGDSMGVVPEGDEYRGYTPEQIRTAALSFLLNSVSGSCNLLPLSLANVGAGGAVNLNLNGFVENSRLATMLNGNPYSCGNPRAPVRVDWLIANTVNPETYNSVMGYDKTLDGLGRQLGVGVEQEEEVDFNGRKIDRVLIAGPSGVDESIVGVHPQRVLEVRSRGNRFGTSFYRSYDFIGKPEETANAAGRDVFQQGINFTADASEMIFTKCNKFLGFALADFNGNVAKTREAPTSIAEDGGPVINGYSCFHCHSNGFNGAGLRLTGPTKRGTERYTDNFAEIAKLDPPGISFHSRFFSRNAAYDARAQADSSAFMVAKRASGAHLEDRTQPGQSLPLLHDMAKTYGLPLSMEQIAKELGTAVSPALQAAVSRLSGGGDGLSRSDFARNFCALRSQFGVGGLASSVRGGGEFQNVLRGGAPHSTAISVPRRSSN